LAALFPILLADSCAVVPKLIVVDPAPGQALTWMPLGIELDFQESASAASLEVLLNGNDISEHFVVEPNGGRARATASFVWEGFVLPGPNQIVASIDTTGGRVHATSDFTTAGDPYADDVEVYTQGGGGGFGSGDLPGVVLGPPSGTGLLIGGEDVLSLGLGGSVIVRFDDNVIVDGPGDDFTVFENAFMTRNGTEISVPFAEPGRVLVSQDGVTFHALGTCNLTDPGSPPWYADCAGVRPVLSDGTGDTSHASIPSPAGAFEALIGQLSFLAELPEGAGGDSFDLANTPIGWARYVRIEGASFVPGGVGGPDTSGFDLDAVAAIRSVPATDANGNGIPDAVE